MKFIKLSLITCFFLLTINSKAQISGVIFRDFNANGLKDNSSTFNEPFLGGITVKAYPVTGSVQTTTSASNGTYSFTGLNLPARIEFSGYLTGDFSGPFGTFNSTSVQFYSANTTSANFGVNYPTDYCQTNPNLVIPVYINGRETDSEAFFSFPYNSSGQTSVNTTLAKSQEIGSTWGVAYDRKNQKIYTSAFLKRHVSMVDNNGDSKEDLGAIYVMSPSGTPSLWLDITTLSIDVGQSLMPTIAARNLPVNRTQPSHDSDVFDLIAKIGIGDIDISDDNSQLFVVNLYDKKVYTIDIASKTLVGSGIEVPSQCTGGESRPFGLKYHRGKVYVGSVCDAQSSQNETNLDANLYRLDGSTFTNILNIPLDYVKGRALDDVPTSNYWRPWKTTFLPTPDFAAYPTPIFADIEFDTNEDLILIFNDRYGSQMGTFNYGTDPNDNNTVTGVASGDILRASMSNSGVYVLENNASLVSGVSTAGAGNGQGPGGGEFYFDDVYSDYHHETVMGGSALKAGSGEVAVAAYDPFVVFSTGIYWMSNSLGTTVDKYQVNETGQVTGSFGKTNGLGDLELLCNPAPIEIGNRVWMDTDNDGVQDADEMGLDNITVKLYKGATLIATKTTSNGGQYYFNTADGVLPNTAYTIRIESASFPSGKFVTLKDQTTGGIQDLGDNDASLVAGNADISYTTGNPGENNHTLDFGFNALVTCSTSVTATPGTCNTTDNKYTLTGEVTLTNPPLTGTLTIQIVGGDNQTITLPHTSPISYTFTGQNSDGANHTVDVSISGVSCTSSTTYDAPASCQVGACAASVTAIPGTCNTTTNQYSVTGEVTLTNPPSSGNLTVQIVGGGSKTFMLPLTSPISYSIDSQISDGASHTVNVSISGVSCTDTTTYTAPGSCTISCPSPNCATLKSKRAIN